MCMCKCITCCQDNKEQSGAKMNNTGNEGV